MSIVQLADVQADLPSFRITDTPPSTVTAAQVTGYIGEIESEVRAMYEATGHIWPSDGSAAAQYLKRTILEGVRWMTLRSWFALNSQNDKGADIDRAYKTYMDRLGDVNQLGSAAMNVEDTQTGMAPANVIPRAVRGEMMPSGAGSFAEYTQAVDWVRESRSMQRWGGSRPWPLL